MTNLAEVVRCGLDNDQLRQLKADLEKALNLELCGPVTAYSLVDKAPVRFAGHKLYRDGQWGFALDLEDQAIVCTHLPSDPKKKPEPACCYRMNKDVGMLHMYIRARGIDDGTWIKWIRSAEDIFVRTTG